MIDLNDVTECDRFLSSMLDNLFWRGRELRKRLPNKGMYKYFKARGDEKVWCIWEFGEVIDMYLPGQEELDQRGIGL